MTCDFSRNVLPDLNNFWYEYSGQFFFFSKHLLLRKVSHKKQNFSVLNIILSHAKEADKYA